MLSPNSASGSVWSFHCGWRPNARGVAGSPTRRMGSRGMPSPMATSGHSATKLKCSARVRLHSRDSLCPPLKRTGSPSRHALIPSLGRCGKSKGMNMGQLPGHELYNSCFVYSFLRIIEVNLYKSIGLYKFWTGGEPGHRFHRR
ncbi:hypothetical protein D3C78_1337020 [compost metagenome]